MNDFFDPNNLNQRLKNLKNAAEKQLLNEQLAYDTQVQLIVNEKISPAMFKPHAFLMNTYEANSLTITAVRKELFAAGNEFFADLSSPIECSCGKKLDQQFWKLCPYCGKTF